MRPKSPSALLQTADAPAFLVTDLTNIRYLTSLELSAGAVLVSSRRYILFVDDRYKEKAKSQVPSSVTVRDVRELQKTLESVPLCGCESEAVTIERFSLWKKKYKNTKFVPKAGVVAAYRRQKEPTELAAIRKAERITREILRRIPAALRRSTTEQQLARQIQIWALELGADGMAFPPIVAFGTHTSRPHHTPTNRTLKPGHIVQIDIGAKVDGYCSDASEVFFTAKPTPIQKAVYTALREAQDAALRLLKAGVTNHDLDAAAREVLRREEFEQYFTHALGHGVGLEIHEGVTISAKATKELLHRDEVITIEPGVYIEGKFGMRLETIAIVR